MVKYGCGSPIELPGWDPHPKTVTDQGNTVNSMFARITEQTLYARNERTKSIE